MYLDAVKKIMWSSRSGPKFKIPIHKYRGRQIYWAPLAFVYIGCFNLNVFTVIRPDGQMTSNYKQVKDDIDWEAEIENEERL